MRPAACLPASIAASVVFGSFPLTCSAKTRTSPIAILSSGEASDHLGFGVERLHESFDGFDLAAALSPRRRLHLQHLEPRRGIDSEVAERDLLQLLLAGFHDAG